MNVLNSTHDIIAYFYVRVVIVIQINHLLLKCCTLKVPAPHNFL